MKKLLASLLTLSFLLTGCTTEEEQIEEAETSAEILRVEESTGENGEPVVNVHFKFKNKTETGKEFDFEYIITGYQNGTELYQYRNDEGYYTKIKDGAEIEGYIELILQDKSPIDLELKRYIDDVVIQELTYEFE